MVPSVEGEFARKRRMMSHTWPIVLRGGMLSPRGYGLGYGLMILSHRILRYGTPALHAIALVANLLLVIEGAGVLYAITLALQLALLAAAALGGAVRAPSAAARALLRAHHDLARGRSVGLAAPRDRGIVGRGRGDALR